MKIIDAHAYLGVGQHLSLDVDSLLHCMDEAKIERTVVCSVDHNLAVHNLEGNDLILNAVNRHSDRLTGMASANPWYGFKAEDELRRVFERGLLGLMLHPLYQGFRLSDPIVNPLLEIAVEFDVPVYAHTGSAGIAEPFHVIELARRYPSLNFMMGHAGSSDYGEDAVRALEFAENVWLETSRNGPANINFWKVRKCLHRVVFGSSAPEYIPSIEIETLCDVVTDESCREAVLSGSIQKVFKGRLTV
ncbi:amidohydrolase family protein [Candidatus Latescibacterota bacterium]